MVFYMNKNKELLIFGIIFYVIITIGFIQAERKADKLKDQVQSLTNELDNLDF